MFPRPALVLGLLVIGLAGCAGRLLPCDGRVTDVDVSVEPAYPHDPLAKEIAGLLKGKAACVGAHHDPQTEQARWSYWVRLEGTQSPDSQGRNELTFHLTHLDRKVTNYLDLSIRELRPAVTLQEYQLDALRAELRIPGGSALMFPCAEILNSPGVGRLRSRSALYRVERVYRGDVSVKQAGSDDVRFVPVKVAFEVDLLIETAGPLADDQARENARRRLEWARVTNTCATCRPLVICESLARAGPPPPNPMSPLDVPDPGTSEVHVVGGLEKRPVVVDAILAQRKRTMVCTRWMPTAGTQGSPFVRYSDSSDQGLSPVTPYLTFHHSAALTDDLRPGKWKIEVGLAEIVDPREDLVPGSGSAARRKAREQETLARCLKQDPVFEQTITVPSHLTGSTEHN